jgi:hypothetical protein
METGSSRRALILIVAVVLLLRLPFLNQAIQGDDPKYLALAQHALIDPAHPSHARYVFQGEVVDMRGHPHPPLNAWVLAALIAIFGDVYEVPFHAVYIVFSLIAALGMWMLARRWSDAPLWPTLLFLATPAFVVNGNSLESDIPFLAFWMLGIALFTSGRLWWAIPALALAAMSAYQAIVATPILFAYCWIHARRLRLAWAVALTPVATFAAYQIYERLTSGALPAAVLAGYFDTYALQEIRNKLKNAAALTAHAGWIVFPAAVLVAFRRLWTVAVIAALAGAVIDVHPLFWISFAAGAVVIAHCVRRLDFLKVWVLIFFAAALVLFFAGSARYLLPLAAPVALLVARERRMLPLAFGANLAVGLALAYINYQHWDGYRQFVRSIEPELERKRAWVTGEWGLRFYVESEGGLPLERTQVVQTGEWIVSSALAFPIPLTAPLGLVAEREVKPSLPLRLIGLDSKSGYSTAALGFRPFDIAFAPADRVKVEAVLERKPTLSWLPMNAPEAEHQLVSGVYQLEDKARWMSARAILLLKPPERESPVEVQIYVPDKAPARQVVIALDGTPLHTQIVPGPGPHTITTRPASGSTLTIVVDKTFSVPGDFRQLGAVLIAAGFK